MRIPLLLMADLNKVKEGPCVRLHGGAWAIKSESPDHQSIPVRVKLSNSPGLHAIPCEFDCDDFVTAQVFSLCPVSLKDVSIYAELRTPLSKSL